MSTLSGTSKNSKRGAVIVNSEFEGMLTLLRRLRKKGGNGSEVAEYTLHRFKDGRKVAGPFDTYTKAVKWASKNKQRIVSENYQ